MNMRKDNCAEKEMGAKTGNTERMAGRPAPENKFLIVGIGASAGGLRLLRPSFYPCPTIRNPVWLL